MQDAPNAERPEGKTVGIQNGLNAKRSECKTVRTQNAPLMRGAFCRFSWASAGDLGSGWRRSVSVFAAASATASWEASAHSSASTAAAPLLALLSGGDRDLFGPRRVGQYFGDFLARPLGVVFGFPKIGR